MDGYQLILTCISFFLLPWTMAITGTKVALILLAPGFEEIELATLYRFLVRAGVQPMLVPLPGPHEYPVPGGHKVSVFVHQPFPQMQDLIQPALILPGGAAATEALIQPIEVGNLLKLYEDRRRIIAAGSTSPKVLQPYRIYETLRVAANPSVQASITEHWYLPSEVVLDQSLVTSRSASASAEFALAIVRRLVSKSMSEKLRWEWYNGTDLD